MDIFVVDADGPLAIIDSQYYSDMPSEKVRTAAGIYGMIHSLPH